MEEENSEECFIIYSIVTQDEDESVYANKRKNRKLITVDTMKIFKKRE